MNNSLSYIKGRGAKIKLEDGLHEFKYDTNAMEYLQSEFGIEINDLYEIDFEDPKNIKKFLLAGLMHEYEKESDIPDLFEIGKKLVIMQVTIDDIVLKYDLNSFEFLCSEFKVPFKKITEIDMRTFNQMKKFLRAGLISNYEKDQAPSLFEVGRMFEIGSIKEFETLFSKASLNRFGMDIGDTLTEAIINSLPEPDEFDIINSKKKMI